MTTDAERRGATDAWTVQIREQQLRDLRAQLAAVTTERDAAVSALRLATGSKEGKPTIVMMLLDKWMEHLADIDRYGQYMRNAPFPRTFAEWQARRQAQVAARRSGEI